MTEPFWLSVDEVRSIHAGQLDRFGGPPGVRDEGALASAVMRPVNRFHYGESDLAVLAAAYAFGLARNHAFVDGNKRAAFLAMTVFLDQNAVRFDPDEDDAIATILALAAGELDEETCRAGSGTTSGPERLVAAPGRTFCPARSPPADGPGCPSTVRAERRRTA